MKFFNVDGVTLISHLKKRKNNQKTAKTKVANEKIRNYR